MGPSPTPTPRGPVAYLVNQYPKVSHSFIRREIAALEHLGQPVRRFAVRRTAEPLPDPADRAELARTHPLLDRPAGLMAALIAAPLRHPRRFARAARAAAAMSARRGLSPGARLKHLAYLAEAAGLARRLTAGGVVHLHAHFGSNSAAVARLASHLTGVPYSFTVHGPEDFDAPHALSLDAKATDAAFVAVISAYGRRTLAASLRPADRDRLVEIRCGLDASLLDQPPPAPSEGPDPLLLFVGRLCERKQPILLCEAFAQRVAQGRPGHLTFLGDGPLRPALDDTIDRLRLRGRVTLHGWANSAEVREHLAAAHALALPSTAEGLPVALMEAMALGRPVITTPVAAVPELVTPDCGRLVPVDDVAALAQAINEVLDADPEQRATWGQAGRARVAARHDAVAEARRLCAAFAGRPAAEIDGAERRGDR